MDGWIMDGSVDRSMDRSIIDGWMDSSIHPVIRAYIHSHRRERFLFHQNVRQRRSNCHHSTHICFLFFQILFFLGPVPAGPEIGWCAQLIPLLKPDKQKEIQDFFEICTFDCFCLFPFGIRQTDKVLISLKRATGKTEGIDLGGEINFVCGERPA